MRPLVVVVVVPRRQGEISFCGVADGWPTQPRVGVAHLTFGCHIQSRTLRLSRVATPLRSFSAFSPNVPLRSLRLKAIAFPLTR